MNEAVEVLLDALKDSAIVLAFVFAFHFLLSFVEGKIARLLEKRRWFAPALGGLFGIVPECGTSVVAADLYGKHHISMGTLIAVFLACSDEALPILFTNLTSSWYMGFVLIACKIAIATAVGIIVDLINYKAAKKVHQHLEEECHGEEGEVHIGCCGHEIEEGEGKESWLHEHILHPVIHSLKIFAYVLVINLAFGYLIMWIGEDALASFLTGNYWFSPLLAIVVGLIPNCASSVLLSDLFVQGALPFGALLSGLLINAGLGVLVLLRKKENFKDAIIILAISFGVSLVSGYIALAIQALI